MHVPSNFRVVCSFAFAVTACSSDGEGNGMNHPGGGGGTSGATTPTSTPIAPIAFDALYVVNGGDATISVIDTGRNEVARTIALRGAQYPHHVYFNSDRSQLALAIPGMDLSAGHTGPGSGEMPGFVQLLNASDGSTLSARQLGAMNHNGVFSPVGNEVWTSQMKSPGDVLVLDATSLQEKARILVQNAPAEVTFSANGKYGFVANSGSDR